jgi:NADPH:quinone reductase-like Zn-dependent oxidoreductase
MSQLTLTAVGGDLAATVALSGEVDAAVGDDDVLIAVEAAPINGADLLFAAGWFAVYPQVPSARGISAPVDATYPLSESQAALARAAQQGRSGKVLFTPNSSH